MNNNIIKMRVSGAEILATHGGVTLDSSGRRILTDVDYIVMSFVSGGKRKVIIKDIDSYNDDVVLMMLMLYASDGLDKVIETYKTANLSFEDIEFYINQMISMLIELERYEEVSKLKDDWDNYIKNNNHE